MAESVDPSGRLVAHRGASVAAPENTLAAFASARAAGAIWVEFDVSLLGDGAAVLHHDPDLGRCTDRIGALGEIGAASLARLDAGSWFSPAFAGERVPSLAAALDWLGAAGMSGNLEMKLHGADPSALVAAVAAALAERPWSANRILVSSFDHAALARLHAAMPHQPLAALYGRPPPDWPAEIRALGAAAMHMNHRWLTQDHLAAALASELALRVYTSNDPVGLAPLRRPGLAGVITDDPAAFLADPGWAAWARRDDPRDQAKRRPASSISTTVSAIPI